jgi:hypothetical protein
MDLKQAFCGHGVSSIKSVRMNGICTIRPRISEWIEIEIEIIPRLVEKVF